MDHRGFTLVEVLIAVSILLIGILAGAGLMAKSLSAQQRAREKTIASQIASSQLSVLQALDPGWYLAWFDRNSLVVIDPAKEPQFGSCTGWSTTVEQVSQATSTYRVTMCLFMTSGANEEFVTYVTPKGADVPDQPIKIYETP